MKRVLMNYIKLVGLQHSVVIGTSFICRVCGWAFRGSLLVPSSGPAVASEACLRATTQDV